MRGRVALGFFDGRFGVGIVCTILTEADSQPKKKAVNIREATDHYEQWMATHLKSVQADLEYKHQAMAESAFGFMRATFYRWMQLWNDAGKDVAGVPAVLAVGDLHVENFGTWRDEEGRLI